MRSVLIIGLLFMYSCTQQIHAPSDFALRIIDYIDTIDTFEGTFTRRGIAIREQGEPGELFRDTTIQFEFTQSQKDSIYKMMGITHFFILPSKLTPTCHEHIMPSSTNNLFTRSNGMAHEVKSESGCITSDKQAKEFDLLLNYIYRIVYRNPQVRRLPDSILFTL